MGMFSDDELLHNLDINDSKLHLYTYCSYTYFDSVVNSDRVECVACHFFEAYYI